jgi:hypothetical protein
VPASWSRKDERQYEHIVSSCTRPSKICKRIAAATVNKRRSTEGRGLGDFVVQAKAIPGHPRTGGWSPGWGPACTNTPLRSHKDANDYIKKIRVAGAQYRIVPGESPRCSNALNLAALAAMAAAGVAVLVMK